MHIPDGFLNAAVAGTTYAVSTGGMANALRIANKKLGEKHIPAMGILAAFVFAAQMLNFPVAAGTSGHFLGAALVAILLGPWAAVLIMGVVLIAQCLVFQDGGLLALGANIFNMGIVGGFSAYFVYRAATNWLGGGQKARTIGGFAAAWISVVLASAACAVELALSGTAPLTAVLASMTGVHALIGVGEGLITVTVVSLVTATRRDLLELQKI